MNNMYVTKSVKKKQTPSAKIVQIKWVSRQENTVMGVCPFAVYKQNSLFFMFADVFTWMKHYHICIMNNEMYKICIDIIKQNEIRIV